MLRPAAALTTKSVATYPLVCRECPETIEVGEKILVHHFDGNPQGCGPAEHLTHRGWTDPRHPGRK